MLTLQDILADLSYEGLPLAWQSFDLTTFSETKRLWDYQREALEYAIKALWKYYEDLEDYHPDELIDVNDVRKEKFWQWYLDNGLDKDLADIRLNRQRRDVRALLEEYYTTEDGCISYRHFINRMGFWMATGSGKTLVLVKLIGILWQLMQQGEIPKNDILVLTARDDLLGQFKSHVKEFNSGESDFSIHLMDLRSYPDVKHSFTPTIGKYGVTVFFYRADNLSDEQKERIVDFRNYENQGRWYVLLDEAHKGDKEESKRQHIYSILSRNGFLFNFSATFTDPRDVLTTVYNFNLPRFVKEGYSKHITILKQENRAFRDEEDYTGEEKQRVVLKALLMLAYVRKAYEALPKDIRAYHRPLMLALVNKVNTKDADLKLFFRELERIGKGEVDEATWRRAKEELWQELAEGPELLFEKEHFEADRELFDSITLNEILRLNYNAIAPGEVEVLLRPSNRKEMAFKLKSAEQPFALVKIGDISGWLKEELEGYEIIEGYEDESFFQRLNKGDSFINILMGSRTFYEGWDSNRPNVITYINIGTQTEAKKFILQSVGRGVRIEPLPGHRKRLQNLHNANVIKETEFQKLKDYALPLETLFILGTNRNALQIVLEQMEQEKSRLAQHEIELEVNSKAINGYPLLIPVYQEAGHTIVEARKPRKFEIAENELNLLQNYVDYLEDLRLLVVHHKATPKDINLLQTCLQKPNAYFNTINGRRYGHMDILIPRLFAYFKVVPQKANGVKQLEDELRHFRHIKVSIKDVRELMEKIERVKHYQDPEKKEKELQNLFKRGEIDLGEYTEQIKKLTAMKKEEEFEFNGMKLRIRYVARHYYLPVILSDNEKINYIKHIVRYRSEIQFLNELERYLEQENNAFKSLDWWAFSKLDEKLDQIYIPYYDPISNNMREFIPDFIFWLLKENEYAIVFVDPKGISFSNYQHKVDGFRDLFETQKGESRVFIKQINGKNLSVRIYLLLFTPDSYKVSEAYRKYWFDTPEAIPRLLL